MKKMANPITDERANEIHTAAMNGNLEPFINYLIESAAQDFLSRLFKGQNSFSMLKSGSTLDPSKPFFMTKTKNPAD